MDAASNYFIQTSTNEGAPAGESGLQVSDLALMRSATGGDDTAFHLLVDRHAKRLFRSALALTRSRSDAEDLLQETFVGAYRGLKNFDGRSTPKTWLTSILIRQAAKAWRKSTRGGKTMSIDAPGNGEADRKLTSPSASGSTDKRLDVMVALKRISRPHREVITLRDLQGLSYEEIAEALGVPRGTVESRLHRARAELREALSSYKP